ncbi:DMT family transporter [Allokutzneria oryzae]|uniref:DMT family transporter n=1 Tax=Allokutzneria oryzae TaxID=1378989 RepID=A0ABV6A201_9PSEU
MTGSATDLWIAVPAAVLAAASFGLTGALQHRAARREPERGAMRLGMILHLLRQPLWLASLLTNGLGIAMQWVALSTAPLVFVQPLLVLSLLFAVISSAALRRQRPSKEVLLGSGLCVAGLATFFPVSRPTAGPGELVPADIPWLAVGLGLALTACLTVATCGSGQVRALAMATATGVLYGVAAGLAKLATADLQRGLGALLGSWHIYLVALCGIAGFVFNQNAFRVEVAIAPALAVIVTLDPLVSLGIGVLWLGERLSDGPGAVIGQVLALAALVGGIAMLSKFAPQAALAAEQAEATRSGPRRT